MKKLTSIIISFLLVLNVATITFAQETASSEKLENELTLQQYEGQPDDDIAELKNELIDEKDFSAITSSQGSINDSIDINTGELSMNSDDRSTKPPSHNTSDSNSVISAFSGSISLFNTDPNNAIFLPESYYGIDLYDLYESHLK